MRAQPEILEKVIAALEAQFKDRLSRNRVVREQHANTTSWLPSEPSDAVVFVESTEEVSDVVKLCAANRVPIIPFGVGSSLEGGVNAPFGGITVDLSRMSKVLAVNEDDMDCVVQPGVTRKQLNHDLRSTGLFFPVDPGADASIGGMASTRASGTTTVRYGTMKDNVLSLTVVMPDGSVRKTGTRARKSAAGYDITRLFVGAEGTLGIITELTLKLHGIPPSVMVATCSFPDLKSACDAVIATIRFGLPMARIELMDELQIRAVNRYSKLSVPEKPGLFVEFNGTEAAVREHVGMFREIVDEFGCLSFDEASSPEERTKLWAARHDLYWACLALRPGSKFLATDVCVPISRLADCMLETQQDIEETGLVAPIVGHVGDGNFHVSVMTDTENDEEMARTRLFIERLSLRAIRMDGTCTGEHGIGQGKRHSLLKEHGANVGTMRMIKTALDPNNIMNPGKLFLS